MNFTSTGLSKIVWLLIPMAIVAWFAEWRKNQQLHAELTALGMPSQQGAALRAENRRLLQAQPTPADWEALQQASSEPATAAVVTSENSTGSPTTVSSWRNAGRGTPAAALETGLWAAANGEIGQLAGMLWFNRASNAKAEALWASLPPAARAGHPSPEALIALLMAKDLPLGALQLLGETGRGPDHTVVRARLQGNDGLTRDHNFTLRRGPGGWDVMVSESAIERYRALLRAPSP